MDRPPTEAKNFNPRSREGSDDDYESIFGDITDFNPRSREGSDEVIPWQLTQTHISIHAPAKGATLRTHVDIYGTFISIHAPAKGATSPA